MRRHHHFAAPARSEQDGRTLSGRGPLASVAGTVGGAACADWGTVGRPRPDRPRRLSPPCLEHCAWPNDPWRKRHTPGGFRLPRSASNGRDRRQCSLRQPAGRTARHRCRECRTGHVGRHASLRRSRHRRPGETGGHRRDPFAGRGRHTHRSATRQLRPRSGRADLPWVAEAADNSATHRFRNSCRSSSSTSSAGDCRTLKLDRATARRSVTHSSDLRPCHRGVAL